MLPPRGLNNNGSISVSSSSNNHSGPLFEPNDRPAPAQRLMLSCSTAFSIASTWPSGFRLENTAATLPSGAIR